MKCPSPKQKAVNADEFRRVMTSWPTGVAVITGRLAQGEAIGVAVGTFCSLSLSPPLVMFALAKNSTTLDTFRQTRRFCVNVLSGHQAGLAQQFSQGDPVSRFADLTFEETPLGLPKLLEAAAWIEATMTQEHPGGDHTIVVGQVESLGSRSNHSPLVFAHRKFGAFTSNAH